MVYRRSARLILTSIYSFLTEKTGVWYDTPHTSVYGGLQNEKNNCLDGEVIHPRRSPFVSVPRAGRDARTAGAGRRRRGDAREPGLRDHRGRRPQ